MRSLRLWARQPPRLQVQSGGADWPVISPMGLALRLRCGSGWVLCALPCVGRTHRITTRGLLLMLPLVNLFSQRYFYADGPR